MTTKSCICNKLRVNKMFYRKTLSFVSQQLLLAHVLLVSTDSNLRAIIVFHLPLIVIILSFDIILLYKLTIQIKVWLKIEESVLSTAQSIHLWFCLHILNHGKQQYRKHTLTVEIIWNKKRKMANNMQQMSAVWLNTETLRFMVGVSSPKPRGTNTI